MSIAEEVTFDNTGEIEKFPLFRKLFLALVIILVSTLSFGIGRLTSVSRGEGVKIEYDPTLTQGPAETSKSSANPAAAISSTKSGTVSEVVASKSGSKYHYANCPGAKQISAKNKITFATPALAEAAGYTLASNCSPR